MCFNKGTDFRLEMVSFSYRLRDWKKPGIFLYGILELEAVPSTPPKIFTDPLSIPPVNIH